MTDLIQLTDAEIAAVAGGAQSIDIHATQTNSSSISQTATATNSGAVTATVGTGNGNTAIAVGASASNTAVVWQANIISASNSIRFSFHW